MNSSPRVAVSSNGSRSGGGGRVTARPGPEDDSASAGSCPWQVFGVRVRQLRSQADASPADLALGEVCSPALLRAIEEGSAQPMRATAEYLDRRLQAGGRLLDSWARAVITTHLEASPNIEPLARQAARVWEFAPGQLPRPLQTENYAQALAQARRPGSFGPAQREEHRRQARSLHTGGIEHLLIVNEAVLRAMPGPISVTREQLQHLRRLLDRDRLSLQVIPAQAHNHPCPAGTFRLLDVSPSHRLVHLPAPCGPGQLATTPAEASEYAALFTALAAAALPREDSAALLERLSREHTQSPPALPPAPAAPSEASARLAPLAGRV